MRRALLLAPASHSVAASCNCHTSQIDYFISQRTGWCGGQCSVRERCTTVHPRQSAAPDQIQQPLRDAGPPERTKHAAGRRCDACGAGIRQPARLNRTDAGPAASQPAALDDDFYRSTQPNKINYW